jgi:hypothetical protein
MPYDAKQFPQSECRFPHGGPNGVSQSVMSSMNYQPIVDRAIGVLTLKDPVYEEIEHDQNATTQAAIVVVVAGLAAGIGSINDHWYSILVSPVGALIAWAVGSYFIYMVGTRLLPSATTEADLGQVLRLIGFAAVPNVLNVLGFVPVLGWILGVIAAILGIIITVKAVMHALEMSVGRAIVTAIVAGIVEGIVLLIIGAIFGVGLWLGA